MKKLVAALLLLFGLAAETLAGEGNRGFSVSFGQELCAEALDGRLLLLISDDDSREPRFQIQEYGLDSQLVFGLDVKGLKPGEKVEMRPNFRASWRARYASTWATWTPSTTTMPPNLSTNTSRQRRGLPIGLRFISATARYIAGPVIRSTRKPGSGWATTPSLSRRWWRTN